MEQLSDSDSDSGPDLIETPLLKIPDIGPPFHEGWLEWKRKKHPEAWFTNLVEQLEEAIDVARQDFLWKLHVNETAKWKLHVDMETAKREAESEAEGGRRKRKWMEVEVTEVDVTEVDGPGIWKQICGEIFRNFQEFQRWTTHPVHLSVILREQEENTHRLVYLGDVQVTKEGFVWDQVRNNDSMVHRYLQGYGDGPLLLKFLRGHSMSGPESWIANLQLALGDSDLRIDYYHNKRADEYGVRHASYISLHRAAEKPGWQLGSKWESELYRSADTYRLEETVPGRLLNGLNDLPW